MTMMGRGEQQSLVRTIVSTIYIFSEAWQQKTTKIPPSAHSTVAQTLRERRVSRADTGDNFPSSSKPARGEKTRLSTLVVAPIETAHPNHPRFTVSRGSCLTARLPSNKPSEYRFSRQIFCDISLYSLNPSPLRFSPQYTYPQKFGAKHEPHASLAPDKESVVQPHFCSPTSTLILLYLPSHLLPSPH